MLFFNKIKESQELDTTESIDVDHIGVGSFKQYGICHFFVFKNRNINYQPYICNVCHDAAFMCSNRYQNYYD